MTTEATVSESTLAVSGPIPPGSTIVICCGPGTKVVHLWFKHDPEDWMQRNIYGHPNDRNHEGPWLFTHLVLQGISEITKITALGPSPTHIIIVRPGADPFARVEPLTCTWVNTALPPHRFSA